METASTPQTSRVSPIQFKFSFSAGDEDRLMMRAISDPEITVADFCRKTIEIMSTGDWVKIFCLIGSNDLNTKKMISCFNTGRTSFVNATLNYGDAGLPTVLRLQNSGSSSSEGVKTGVDVYVTAQKNCDDDDTPVDELFPTDSLVDVLFGYDQKVHVQICSVKAGEKWVPDDIWDEPIQPIIVSYKDGKLIGKGRQMAKRRATEPSSESNNSKKKRVSNDEDDDEDQPPKESNINDADAENQKGKEAATKEMQSPKKKPRKRNPSVWDERFLDVVEFQIEHGEGTFPEPDSTLGKWISTQQRQYGKKLSKEHVAQLDSLNINWESSENKSDSTTKTLNGKETNGKEASLQEEIEDAKNDTDTASKNDEGEEPQPEEPQPEEPPAKIDEVSTPQTAKKKEKKSKVRSEKKSNKKKSKKKSSRRKSQGSIRISVD